MFSKLRRLIKSDYLRPSSASMQSRVPSGSRHEPPRLLFAFHGRNKTWPDVGCQIYREEAIFREAIRRCSSVAEGLLGFSLSDFFAGLDVGSADSLEQDEQRNLVISSVLELALCEVWRSREIEPEAAVGISCGEVAAAYSAGALSLEESAAVSCSVARLLTQKPLEGHFVWLDVDFERALQLCRMSPAKLDVFLEISPISSLAYCTSTDFPDIQRFLSGNHVTHRAKTTEWAHHTPGSNALSEIAEKLYKPKPRPLDIPLYSSEAGGLISPGIVLSADHWYWAAVLPAMFGRTICATMADGFNVILNVCGHPSLKGGIQQSATTLNKRIFILDTMRRGESELMTLDESFQALSASGLTKARSTH